VKNGFKKPGIPLQSPNKGMEFLQESGIEPKCEPVKSTEINFKIKMEKFERTRT
jgi:hypothetical protein